MKKQFLLSLLILMLGLSVSAQRTKLSTTEKNLRKHVAYLASEELEGRRTGERGATFAAGYVSNMFQRYKLQGGFIGPDGKNSYMQPFDFVSGVEFGDSTALGNLEKDKDWAPFIYSPSASVSSAQTVFVVYGVSSARLGYDDYSGIDVKGKVVVVLDGVPGGSSPRNPFNAYNVQAKANTAKEKGAVALIVVSKNDDLSNERLANTAFNQTLGETAVPVAVVTRSKGSELLNLGSGTELNDLESWLASKPEVAEVKFAGLKPSSISLTIDSVKQKTLAYNVIGILPGRDKTLKDEAIIIGAHYDHLGRGGDGSLAPNSKDIHHGADDNASGTSALLELAREFRKEKKNRRTIIFIGFGGEEEGLLGSKAYTNDPVFPLEKTIAMFNLDMVGRLKDKKLTVGGIGTAENFESLVTNSNSRVPGVYAKSKSNSFAASKEDIQLFDLQLNQDGFGPSDHSSFYAVKIPVLFFFTGTHSDYHKPSDTAEKINYEGLEGIRSFVGDLVRLVDGNMARPVYKTAPVAQNEAGRRGFNVSLGTIPGYGDSDNTGLMLEGVREGSAAEKAGIKGGDKLVKIAGKEVRNITDYVFMLGEMEAGKEYEVVVIRDGKEVKLKIVPDPRN